jgi:glycosyl transferase family 25
MGKEKNIGIDRIYVVHAPKGYESHAQRLDSILKDRYGFDYEFLEKDRDDLISTFFTDDISKTMGKGNLLCSLNHIMFYRKTIEDGVNLALILEDDPFFIGSFPEKLKQIMPEVAKLDKGFIVSLENSTLTFPPRKSVVSGKHLYEAATGRCAGAYLIDRQACVNILHRLAEKKCEKVIDHWHNILVKEGVFRIYWAHPPFVEQGSINGKLSSDKSTKTQGLIRRIKWQFHKFYKTHILYWIR